MAAGIWIGRGGLMERARRVLSVSLKGAIIRIASLSATAGKIDGMVFSFLYLAFRALLGALVRSRRGLDTKDIELLVLRHEIAAGRHGFEARTLLGERFCGIVCSDRWRGYDYLDPNQRQLCWAHLLRDFIAHSEGMGEQERFGDDGVRIARDLFACWEGYQQDGDHARLQAEIGPLHDELRTLLEHAARKSTRTKYHRLFAKSLLKRWPGLWTFTHQDGVEPTNNHAERGLRAAVIYRKLSLGSQSEHGECTIERLLSASLTCRLQGRSLFAYLSDVLHANIRGDPIPALA